MRSSGMRSPVASVEWRILSIRGQRVMLDADLAAPYGVSTRGLNQAVKRNRQRFPGDFMFRLTAAFSGFRHPFPTDFARKLEELERKYDARFKVVFDAIRALMAPPEKARRSIGFRVEEAGPRYRVRRSPRRAPSR